MTSHPETHLVYATCATCGTDLTFRSTAATIAVEVCSSCHPAYTGAERRIARGDRIEQFNRRRALSTV